MDFSKYWGGIDDFRNNVVKVSLILCGFIKFYLYKCRNKKVFPRGFDLIREWDAEMTRIRKSVRWDTYFRGFMEIINLMIE